MLKKFIKNIIVGDPYAKQKQYERLAKKRAMAGRAIDVGVDSYRLGRYGNKKLSRQEMSDVLKFKKEIMTPQKKKSFDSIINDFIPNQQNVGKVDMNFMMGSKSKRRGSSLDDLAKF